MDAHSPGTDIRRELVALLPQIRRFAMTLTPDAGRVDELVASACEQAIQKSHQWHGERRLEPRLFALLRALSRGDPRKRKAGEADARPEKPAAREKTRHSIIDTLTKDNAAIFLLCVVEGLSYLEAAAVMGIAPEIIADSMVSARRELAAAAAAAAERRA